MFADPLTQTLSTFIESVGITVRRSDLPEATFLPGIEIRRGVLHVDESKLAYPGDLLHEAGHIAVASEQQREQHPFSPHDADELAAIAWSYAAALHLGVDPAVVLHEHGYGGGGPHYADQFAKGQYFGVPLLQYYGMTVEPRLATENGSPPFPHMLRWMR